MNIFEKTADLAVSIRQSREYSEFIETKKEIEKTPSARDILKEYRARQFALELAELAGDNFDEVSDALAEICDIMEEDDLLSRYLEAEYKLFHMMQRIQEIFAEKLELETESDGESEGEDRAYPYIHKEPNIYLN
ncbi:MAG: YlbF family regulator [Bacillota bacterium]|jgi:cell fate (sporulation/competence/biofilm development) regulator YlbF (YheA/YmcA/DUF963 family)